MISFGGAASCPLADRMLRDEGFVSWSHFELGGASARLTPGPMGPREAGRPVVYRMFSHKPGLYSRCQ